MPVRISHLFFAVFLIFYAFLLLKPVSLTNSDLGRHITNGTEILRGNWQVLFQNTYSFSLPNQPFVNHHWLTGVVFALIYQATGFSGLHILHTLILAISAGLLYWLVVKKSSWETAGFVLFPTLLFLAARTEIRPESFGLLFLLIQLHWVDEVLKKKALPKNSWWLLPLLQLIWVNTHISFIFSPFVLIVLLFTTSFWKNKALQKKILFLLGGVLLATLLNPNHILGALSPLTIFQDYGYRVFENQTLWFLRDYYRGPIIPLYFLSALVTGLAIWFAPPKTSIFEKVLAGVGIILGYVALRNILLFVVMSFPLIAKTAEHHIKPVLKKIRFDQPEASYGLILFSLYLFLFIVVKTNPFFGKTGPVFAVGLKESQQQTLAFLKTLPPKTAFFNNYDLGSALIFALYPENRVFVDNRPEAYSSEFFNSLYVPMQQSDALWQEQLALHNFQYILFGHRDITPWAQNFMKQRLRDPDWAVIYLDDTLLVFVKRTQKNQALIQEKEIQVPLSRLGI